MNLTVVFSVVSVLNPNSWHLLAQMESSMTPYYVSYGTGWKRDVERPSM